MHSTSPLYYIRSSALTGFPELCRSHHLNPITLLAQEGLTPSVLRSEDLKVPYESFIRILTLAAEEANFPLFALALSQRHGIETLGPLGLLASQCPTLADSLETIQKYVHFHAQGIQLAITSEEKETRFAFSSSMECNIDLTPLMELGIGRSFNVLRSLLPAGCCPSRIHFHHQPQASVADYEALFGIEVRFGQSDNSVVFPSAYLTLPPPPASDKVRDYFETFLAHAGRNQESPLKHQVMKLIRELIPTGDANASSVASLLGIHTRALQRELNAVDTDFRSLLEEVRYDLARELLTHPGVSLTDLALQLGYSELSAFSRAFKRWSGCSPKEWRERHGNAPLTTTPAG